MKESWSWQRRGDDGELVQLQADPPPAPVYYIALCVESAKDLPEIYPSILYPTRLDLLRQYQGYATWAKKLDEELRISQGSYQALVDEHEKIATWAKKLDKELRISQGSYQALVDEHEKTATWAKKLDEELQKSREKIQALDLEAAGRSEWALGLIKDLAEIS